MKILDRILGGVTGVFTLIGAFALVAMMVHITLDVVLKALFGSPVPVTMEATSFYYMTAVVMLPLAALERHGDLVYVELFYDRMGPGIRYWLYLLVLTIGAVYCLTVAYAAWFPAMRAMRVGAYAGSLIRIEIWPTRFLPVAGFGLLGLILAWKLIITMVKGTQPTTPATDHDLPEGKI